MEYQYPHRTGVRNTLFSKHFHLISEFLQPVMKSFIYIILSLPIAANIIAQPNQYLDNPSMVVPPSPDAAGLGKYGQYPVNMHTGIPNIDIPLYQVKSKQLSLDVSLSYHASGFRVDEIASWTGLGWSLNCGGVITRTVQGLPDDHSNGFYNYTVKYSADLDPGNDYDYMDLVSRNLIDVESDYYFINVAGMTGKFIFDRNKNVLTIPEATYVVDDSDFPNGFTITADDGTIYKFYARERTVSDPYNVDNLDYTSSWYLSTIKSADGKDSIQFVYSSDNSYTINSFSYNTAVGPKNIVTGTDPQNGEIVSYQPVIQDEETENSWDQEVYAIRLDSVKFTDGFLTFIKSSDRKDLPDSRLDKINIFKYDYGTQSYAVHRSINFLNNHYFAYNNGSPVEPLDAKQHRLKLNGILEKDAQGTTIKEYEFHYNEETLLPPKGDKAQDHWGFYNGKINNTDLIPNEIVSVGNHTYHVGGADREPDPDYMDACVITRIDYPTGGHTEFTYDNHLYGKFQIESVSKEAQAAEMWNTTELLTDSVTFVPSISGWATLVVYTSNVTDAEPFFSTVTLKDDSTGTLLIEHIYDPYTYPPFPADHTQNYDVYLWAGTSYTLKAQAKGNSLSTHWGGAAYAQGILTYEDEIPGSFSVAGGLRISQIKTYADPLDNPIIETYKYGMNESGVGTFMIPSDFLSAYAQEKTERLGATTASACNYHYADRIYFYGNTVNPLSTLNGSTVTYEEVSKYIGTSTTNIGKTVNEFDVTIAEIIGVTKSYKNGRLVTNNHWKDGHQTSSSNYKSGETASIRSESTNYAIFELQQDTGFKGGYRYVHSGCRVEGSSAFMDDFYYFEYPIYSGIKKLSSRTVLEKEHATSADEISFTETYYYDNLDHQQVTRVVTEDSEGREVETRTKYPQDFKLTVDNFSTLVPNNIINLPIRAEKLVDGKLVEGTVTRYDNSGKPIEVYNYENSDLIAPAAHDSASLGLTSDYRKRLTISYDGANGNLSSFQKEEDITSAYIWGYNNTLPAVRVDNSSVSVLSIAVSDAVSAIPGNYNDLEDLLEAVGDMSQSSQRDTWQLFSNSLRNQSSFSNSQVYNYTYDPLVGMTSATDPRGFTTYYEYDDFGRLQWIIDSQENIVKKYEYEYNNDGTQ